MATVKKNEDMLIVGSNMRIERGPKLVKGVATPELLSDEATASHYKAGMLDAAGNVIEEGSEFEYLDFGGSAVEGKLGFYVYKRRDLTPEDRAKEETSYTYRYDEIGFKATEEAAIELAQKHAQD